MNPSSFDSDDSRVLPTESGVPEPDAASHPASEVQASENATAEGEGPHSSVAIPAQIDAYRIVRLLGAGGMGNVYLGQHQQTGEEVAIKVLPASLARETGFVARFNREIAVLSRLSHPHIVRLIGSGTQDEMYYYTMEYVAGETVTQRLRREKRISWRETLNLAIEICGALKAAHDAGVIHRDLKPSNLLIGLDGKVKLTDFGVAQLFAGSRLTLSGGVIGTAEYMSPEQAQGTRVTNRSDLYSLGAVIYVMLTGRPPFTGSNSLDIIQKHRYGQFDRPKMYVPELPSELDDLIVQLLSKDPSKRPPDAYVLSRKFQEILRKLEYRKAGELAESQSRGGPQALVPEGLSPTAVREFVKAELSRKEEPTFGQKIFYNTWVLWTMFIILCLGIYQWISQTQLSPEEQFRAAKAVLNQPPSREWIVARDKYLVPLQNLDSSSWREAVKPLMEQVELYEVETSLTSRRKSDRLAPVESEPERIARVARSALEAGDAPLARRLLQSLIALVAGQPEFAAIEKVARRQLESLSKTALDDASRKDFVRTALDRADKLASSQQTSAAREIWQAVVDVYGLDPLFAQEVTTARRRLE